MQIKENTQMDNRNRLHIDRVGIFGGIVYRKLKMWYTFQDKRCFSFARH